MPGRDGTGPYGLAGERGIPLGCGGWGAGRGIRCGTRGLGLGPCGVGMSDESRKELLKLRKEALNREVESIDRLLGDR